MTMKTITLQRNAALLAALLLAAHGVQAQHGHLNAGAAGTSQSDALTFANGNIFAASSGYVKNLLYTNGGTYAGFFQGGITLTALATTTNNGGPVLNAPAPGSFIRTRIESVSGPAGGTFGFWEEGAASPTLSMTVGSLMPTALWDLSDAGLGAGQPGADPFGHHHGRRLTADMGGTYTVGFRLYDTSANGAGGGPIHTASDLLLINFAAVPEPGTIALLVLGGGAVVLLARRRK